MTHPTIAAVAKAIETADVSDAVDGATTYFNALAAATLRTVADQLDEHWGDASVPPITSAAAERIANWLREICSEEGL